MSNPPAELWKCNDSVMLSGDVTQLQAIAMSSPDQIARNLGIASQRFVRGYWICLLKIYHIGADFVKAFKYAGNTMRSGRRMGTPEISTAKDQARPHVDDLLRKAYGEEGYRNAQIADLQRISEKGHNRLVKIVPLIRHIRSMVPAMQYPVGGAHLQWTLRQERKFICGAFVDGAGLATTKMFTTSIAAGAPRENFFRLERYLEQL